MSELQPTAPKDGTLRDLFAGLAMHALVAEPPWVEGGTASVHKWSKDFSETDHPCDRFAFAAYRMADAMLRARDMSPKPETENTSDEHVGGENT